MSLNEIAYRFQLLNLDKISIILSVILLTFFFNKLLVFIIDKKLKSFFKQNSEVKIKNFKTFLLPFKFIPLILVIFFISIYFELEKNIELMVLKFNKSLIIIFIFWSIYNFISIFKNIFSNIEKYVSIEISSWIYASLKYLFLFLGLVAILDTWGIKIGPVIAGLGLFGVAVALGAQDLFKNLISGVLIIAEKRFSLGDIVKVTDYPEGVVENIGFRSTIIRNFDSVPMSIPNYIFSESILINYSQRSFRRITWILGLKYSTTKKQLEDILSEIKDYVKNSTNFIIDQNHSCNINIDKFNNFSIDILVSVFVNTKEWNEYLRIKEELALKIKIIIEEAGTDFAYPTQTIHIESDDSRK